MLAHPVLWLFAAIALGVVASDLLPLSASVWGLASAILMIGLWVCERRRQGAAFVGLLAIVAVAGFAGALQQPPSVQTIASRCGAGDEPTSWRVMVDGPLERSVRSESGRTRIAQKTVVRLLAEQCGDVWRFRERRAQGRVLVSLVSEGLSVVRGDVLVLRMRTVPLSMKRNPTDADPEDLALRFAAAGRGMVRGSYAVVERGTGLVAALDRFRDAAGASFERALPSDTAALSKALALGDRASLDTATRDAWADAGLAHILAISGLHVALCAALVFWILRRVLAYVPMAGEAFSIRRVAALLTIPAVVLFCMWTGGCASSVRSTVMSAAYLLAIASRRPNSAANALGVAGAAIVLVDPASLYDPGFLLSFVAVGMLLALPRMTQNETPSWVVRAWRWVWNMLVLSVAATLVTAPITAHYFGRVSLAGIVTNLIGVPLGAWVATPVALAFALFGFVAEYWGVASIVARPLDWTMRAMDELARRAAMVPGAAFDVPHPTACEWVFYLVLVGAALLAWRSRGRTRRWFVAVAGIALCCFAACVVLHMRSVRAPTGELRVTFAYVGQGDGALIRLPQGGVMLVDAGGSYHAGGWDPGRGVIAPMLRAAGLHAIDLVVLTHPHPDHLNGLDYISKRFAIRELWCNGERAEHGVLKAVIARVRAGGGVVRLATDLPVRSVREGVEFVVLHPRPSDGVLAFGDAEGLPYYPMLETNDNSLTLHLRFGARTLLLTGDVEHEAEAYLAQHMPASGLGAVDILKVAHHGSKTSSTEVFLRVVRPRLAVMSCGENNDFGFPHREVVERYASLGIPTLRTDVHGAVTVTTDGKTWRVQNAMTEP